MANVLHTQALLYSSHILQCLNMNNKTVYNVHLRHSFSRLRVRSSTPCMLFSNPSSQQVTGQDGQPEAAIVVGFIVIISSVPPRNQPELAPSLSRASCPRGSVTRVDSYPVMCVYVQRPFRSERGLSFDFRCNSPRKPFTKDVRAQKLCSSGSDRRSTRRARH